MSLEKLRPAPWNRSGAQKMASDFHLRLTGDPTLTAKPKSARKTAPRSHYVLTCNGFRSSRLFYVCSHSGPFRGRPKSRWANFFRVLVPSIYIYVQAVLANSRRCEGY